MSKFNHPYLLLFISILSVSLSSIMIKFSDTPTSVAGMYRLLISVVIMLPFIPWRKFRSLRLTAREGCIIALAGLFLGLHFLFWMESLVYTSVASSMVILTLQPVLVMIGAYFLFKERVTLLKTVSLTAAVTGSAIIAWGDIGVSRAALIGDGLSFAGTFFMAVYMLAGQKVSRKIDANVYSIIVFSIGSVVLLIYNVYKQVPLTEYHGLDWIYFVLLAIIPTIFGQYIFNILLKSLGATTVSVGIIGEPVLAILLAYLLIGEGILVTQFLGGMMTLIGVGIYFWSKNKLEKRRKKDGNDRGFLEARYTRGND